LWGIGGRRGGEGGTKERQNEGTCANKGVEKYKIERKTREEAGRKEKGT